ncbi:MAG: ribonuclease H-like domain-containing protein [bacterium]|nr:ribonuclease H-like domain-containing protein [bacterium]
MTNQSEIGEAYLDIETSYDGRITIVGVYREDNLGTIAGGRAGRNQTNVVFSRGTEGNSIQLIGQAITPTSVLEVLQGIETIFSYNGNRFDLPVIKRVIGLDLRKYFKSSDLMYDCWRQNLYGGLKAVERKLGIKRRLPDVDGRQAMALWARYERFNDNAALEKLLIYNREDIENLPALREKLAIKNSPRKH